MSKRRKTTDIAGAEELRVGVFVCECGINISSTVDCDEVTEWAGTLPDVVCSVKNRYTCSEPGQQEIKRYIQEENLNRVVVASCSPRMHEPTFRRCCADAGLNPYLFEMANIREHCSWVHSDRGEATQKAKDIVKIAVAKARILEPQEELEVPVTQAALVVGGGIAGMQASLDLADAGYQVYLVEKEPTVGGLMSFINKTFPTMDWAVWVLGPRMMDVGRHPRIKLLTYSEVEEITGYIGNFHVRVRKKARYVDEDACTACKECVKVCPVVKPDEHQLGFATRKAVYIPFAQAVPAAYLINMEDCLGNNPIACGKCAEVCDPRAIDYDQKDEFVEFDVGVAIVATGMDIYDPTVLDEYHYTKYENVLTSWEFEILTGPGYVTKSELLRPTDRKLPKSIAFIQCVGSRSEKRGNPYCSNICCMNTVKDTLYLKDHHPEMECVVFYIDMRTFGKGYEELYKRSKALGVKYIRGIPGDIVEDPKTKNLHVTVENTTTGRIEKHGFEMVMLSIGVIPRPETGQIQRALNLSKTPDGFLMESHYQLGPIDSPTRGVFLAGACESPKDIKSSVIQASGAAARAETLLSAGKVKVEPITPTIIPDLCKSCGICAEVCPYGLITVDKKAKSPAIVVEAACKGCGTCGAACTFGAITMKHFTDEQILTMIDAMVEERPEEKICIFACNWCSYAGADLAGLSRMQYPPNGRVIRTMCSGRVDEEFIWHAFKKGAPIVLVSGCHFVDCHYIDANRWTQKRVEGMWNKLERKGIRPERLQLEWVSAAESSRWQEVMYAVEELRKTVTKKEIEKTQKILSKG